MSELETIKAKHKKGIVGIVQSYGLTKIIWSLPSISSFIVSTGFLIFLIFSPKINEHDILIKLSDLSLTIFPSLLGFSLGGYALIIGFGNTALLKSLTKPKNETDFTIFQRMNGIFAFGLLLQVFSLIIAFLVKLIATVGSGSVFLAHHHPVLCQVINMTGNFLLVLGASWSLAIIPFIVSNVFLFGQMHHLYLTTQRIIEDKKKAAKEEDNQPV